MKFMLYQLCIGLVIGEVLAYFLIWLLMFGGLETMHHLMIVLMHLMIVLMKAVIVTFTAYTSEFI